jgi:hypothetical protein
VGRTHRLDQLGGRVAVGVGPAGDDHCVRVREVVEPVVGFQAEAVDVHRAAPAEGEVVPGVHDVGQVGSEDLDGHGQFVVEHAVGDGQCNSRHVRNCTRHVVSDARAGRCRRDRMWMSGRSGSTSQRVFEYTGAVSWGQVSW